MFEVYDADGNLQISPSDSVMTLKSKVVLTPSGTTTNEHFPFQGSVYTLTVSNVIAPFIAWRVTSGSTVYGLSFIKAVFSGNNVTYTFVGGIAGLSITFYVFDYAKQVITTPSTYGLVVYSPTGEVLYDAIQSRPMKIVDVIPVAAGAAASNVSVPANKAYATGFFEPGGASINQSSFNFLCYFGYAGASTTTATIGTSFYFVEDSSLSDAVIQTIGAVIDVTGY